MRRRFAKAQILGFLREAAAGTPIMDLCWNHCFSRSTFRAWKAKYGDLVYAQAPRRTRDARRASAAAD
jgi:putative transposase